MTSRQNHLRRLSGSKKKAWATAQAFLCQITTNLLPLTSNLFGD
ncbi:MAG: hypothetical protein RLZZ185_1506 [Bacteroidota bacterium]